MQPMESDMSAGASNAPAEHPSSAGLGVPAPLAGRTPASQDTCPSTRTTLGVHICPTTGRNFDLQIPARETIEGLKQAISKKIKLPKERINLLLKDRLLKDGTLLENGVVDDCKLTLLPNVESGLSMSHKADDSVMQALENLSELQVNDFLNGKSPLTLAMRLGEHMMFVQIQLAITAPATNDRAAASAYSASPTPCNTVPRYAPPHPLARPVQRRTTSRHVAALPFGTPLSQATLRTASAAPPPSSTSIPTSGLSSQQAEIPKRASALRAPPVSPLQPPSVSCPNISPVPSPTLSPESPSPPCSLAYPIPIHAPHFFSGPVPKATPLAIPVPIHLEHNKDSVPNNQAVDLQSHRDQRHHFNYIPRQQQHQGEYVHPHIQSQQPRLNHERKSAQPATPQRCGSAPDLRGKVPTLGNSSLTEAKRSLSLKLKEFSQRTCPSTSPKPKPSTAEVKSTAKPTCEPKPECSRSQGAIIETMHHLGHGVFSGTFSGTLNPALQDRDGKPKRSINTIIHILNDLLSSSPHYKAALAGNTDKGAVGAKRTNRTPSSPARKVDETRVWENKATRGKMQHVQMMLEERRRRRQARRQARTAPYTSLCCGSDAEGQRMDHEIHFCSSLDSDSSSSGGVGQAMDVDPAEDDGTGQTLPDLCGQEKESADVGQGALAV